MISNLYKKVDEFEKRLSFKEKLLCKEACSRCCYTDISVFEVEANFIRQWFKHLHPDVQEKLRADWSLPSSESMNFANKLTTSCPFLIDERCSIYNARPLICRTQGLPLKFSMDEGVFVDICPLNEDLLDAADMSEVLNLDLLNMILVQLEREDSGASDRKRVKLSDLKNELLEKKEKCGLNR
ncbi:MAG: YkgJ family cysteine cluster protein [Bacteriovoracia bacterium]